MNNREKILKEIFENPTHSFHIRELARATKLNPNTIINITNELKKEKVITKTKNKHLMEIKTNIENQKVIREKRLFNLNSLYNSGLVDFLIRFYNNPEAIVVVGSYSNGEDFEKSDIDIVIITNKKEMPNVEFFQKKLRRKIHILASKRDKFSDEFYKNLINGVVLHGYLR